MSSVIETKHLKSKLVDLEKKVKLIRDELETRGEIGEDPKTLINEICKKQVFITKKIALELTKKLGLPYDRKSTKNTLCQELGVPYIPKPSSGGGDRSTVKIIFTLIMDSETTVKFSSMSEANLALGQNENRGLNYYIENRIAIKFLEKLWIVSRK